MLLLNIPYVGPGFNHLRVVMAVLITKTVLEDPKSWKTVCMRSQLKLANNFQISSVLKLTFTMGYSAIPAYLSDIDSSAYHIYRVYIMGYHSDKMTS